MRFSQVFKNLKEFFAWITRIAPYLLASMIVTLLGIHNPNITIWIITITLLLLLLNINNILLKIVAVREKKLRGSPSVTVINRNTEESSESYPKLISYLELAKETIHIISPAKANNSLSRKEYLKSIEWLVSRKRRKDKSFIYSRIVTGDSSKDTLIMEHCRNIEKLSNGSLETQCSFLPELGNSHHFIIIDSKIVILFFSKLCREQNKIICDDSCLFHLVLQYEEAEPYLRYLRQVHNQLSRVSN